MYFSSVLSRNCPCMSVRVRLSEWLLECAPTRGLGISSRLASVSVLISRLPMHQCANTPSPWHLWVLMCHRPNMGVYELHIFLLGAGFGPRVGAEPTVPPVRLLSEPIEAILSLFRQVSWNGVVLGVFAFVSAMFCLLDLILPNF